MYRLLAPTAFDATRPAAEVLRIFAQAGIAAVELWGGDAQHVDLADEAQVAALREVSARLDVNICSIHAPFGDGADLAALDEGQRQSAVAAHQVVVRAAALLGVRHIVIHASSRLPENADVAAHTAAARHSIHRLAEDAALAGVKLAVENLPPGYIGRTADQLAQLVDDIPADVAGYCLDTGHAHVCGLDCAQMACAMGQRLVSIHWHDNHGQSDEHLLPGFGDIPWPPLFNALAQINCPRPLPLTVEARPPAEMTLSEALAHVQQLLASLARLRVDNQS